MWTWMALPNFGRGSGGTDAGSRLPEMKRLTDDGALFIGRTKTFIVEERQIIPA